MKKCHKNEKLVKKVANFWKKSVKKSQTSEKKTQKCKFGWEKVTN